MIYSLDFVVKSNAVSDEQKFADFLVLEKIGVALARMRNFHRLNLESSQYHRFAKFQFRYPCILIYNLFTREYGQTVLLCLRDVL